MPLSEMTLGHVVRRFLLYVGIAIVVLLLVGAAVVLTKGAIGGVAWPWVALAVFTVGLFWVVIKQSRAYWRHVSFWLVIAALLVVHLLAFTAILRAYPQWREIWFWPIIVVEAGLFGAILYLLFGERKRG
jgi:hypothetical protein